MAVSRQLFEFVRSEFGLFASWAVWAEVGARPKSNMGDLSIFDEPNEESLLGVLNTDFVIVGLNISTINIEIPLSNFHGENGEVYKARYAFEDTPLWGAYMTDIIKDFKESKATKMMDYLRANPDEETSHCSTFESELGQIRAERPTLIALGNDVFEILDRRFANAYKIVKLKHYAWPVPKEKYRGAVLADLKTAGILN